VPTIHQHVPDLSLDGQVRPDLAAALLELEVSVPVLGVSEVRVRLGVLPGAGGDPAFGWAGLSIGRRLAVTVEHPVTAAVFVGDVTRVVEHHGEGPPTLTVLARDDLHRLDRTVSSRVFEDMTLADVVATLAGDAGLLSEGTTDDDEHRWVQASETDLRFLVRHVSDRGLTLRLEDGRVTVRRLAPTGTAVSVSPSTVRRLELAADIAGASTAVTVAGWDLSEGVGVEQTAVPGAARPKHQTAADVLDALGWSATRRLSRDMAGPDTARQLAVGVVSRPEASLLDGVVELDDPTVAPGRPVVVSGVSPRFAGRWIVTDVTHRFDTTAGWVTRAALVRDAWPTARAGRRRPS
jgi:phage protein D